MAQLPQLHRFGGDTAGDGFGWSVASAGDVDGDGTPDVVVGIRLADVTALSTGAVRVFSGAGGALLHDFPGDAQFDHLGMSVAGAGDVDGDGTDDVVGGAYTADAAGPQAGYARIWSGAGGSVLHTLHGSAPWGQFGRAVAGVGDVNGDGHDDVLVGAHEESGNGYRSGSARLFSGDWIAATALGIAPATPSVLFEYHGDSADDRLGEAVAGGGDVDGDGVPDFAVSATRDDNNGPGSGMARVYSGADGSVLHTFDGPGAGDAMGVAVSISGDVNGDGRADVAVGAYRDDDNGPDSGSAWVFSGLDGSVLHAFFGDAANDQLGISMALCGDLDGDGLSDVAVGANLAGGAGVVRLHSGGDGRLIATIAGEAPGDELGWSVAGAGDLNGDGLADVVAGARYGDGSAVDSGTALVLTACGARAYGGAQALSLAWLPGAPGAAAQGLVHGAGAVPAATGVAVAATGPAGTVAAGVPILVDPDPARHVLVPFTWSASGTVDFPAGLVVAGLGGTRLHLQLFAASGALSASNGLELLLCN